MARIVARATAPADFEGMVDLHAMGSALSPLITDIMESMHTAQPHHGYHPIAWHNVFWDVASEYESLLLALDQRDPFCETDRDLTDHIIFNYHDVVATSRPSITRRRTRLYSACEELIQARVRDYLSATRTIDGTDHTY